MNVLPRRGIAAIAVALATGLLVPSSAREALIAQAPATMTLSILGTSDFHGALLPRDGRGGIAVLAGYINNLRAARARDGGAVLLIDAGDMFQGTLESNLSEGASVVAAYNTLRYDAAAIGNHEFDFGPIGEGAPADADLRGALKARAAEARFPFLAANVLDSATGQPVTWPNVHPSTMITRDGVRIGIVGVTSENTLAVTAAANTRGLSIGRIVPIVTAEATRLRGAGATIVVLAAHAGGRCEQFTAPADLTSCDPNSELFGAIRDLPAGLIDAVVAGHTHNAVAHEVRGVPIVQSYSSARAFGRIDLTVDKASGRAVAHRVFPPHEICRDEQPVTHTCDPSLRAIEKREPVSYEGQPIVEDAALSTIAAEAALRVDAVKRSPLGVVADAAIRRARDSESALGNLVADFMRLSLQGADVGMTNGGGVRKDLPAGALTYGDLYEVLPFDNRLVRLSLTGAQLTEVMATNLQATSPILSISGVRVQARCEASRLVVRVTRDSGAALADSDRIVLATTDFLFTGGDNVFTGAGALTDLTSAADNRDQREAIAASLRVRGGRLDPEQFLKTDEPRWSYPGSRPVRCGA